jgi:hypothetical protein
MRIQPERESIIGCYGMAYELHSSRSRLEVGIGKLELEEE